MATNSGQGGNHIICDFIKANPSFVD